MILTPSLSPAHGPPRAVGTIPGQMALTYGTEISFRLGPGQADEARAIARRLAAAAEGCREHVLFVDDERGEYGCLAVWDEGGDAAAFTSSALVADELQRLAGILGKEPRIRSYEMEYQRR